MQSKWYNHGTWRSYVLSAGICIFLSLLGQFSWAQKEAVLKGLIQKEDGLPLAGASITVKDAKAGFNQGTQTDSLGMFYVRNIPVGSLVTIQVSYQGYKSQTFNDYKLSGNTTTSFYAKLVRDTTNLDEVVVIGYGSQRRTTISNAVTKVELDGVGSRTMQNIGDVLQGKASGVTVSNEGGDPTAQPHVYVRGMGGLNGESALYVVDGVIYSGTPNLNPNDIASIDVLKDASAAIYGARASGGVILITTKKGKSGDMKVFADVKYGNQTAWRKLHSLNAKQYADAMNTAADNAGQARIPAFDASIYPDGQITKTDWVDDIFRSGETNEYNLNMSGGNEKSTYFMGFGYRKAEGILLNTYNQRYNGTINSEHKLTNWLTFGEHMQYNYSNGNGANTSNAYYGALVSAMFYPPSVPVYTSTGAFSGLPEDYAGSYGDVLNPVAYLKRLDSKSPTNILFINPYLEAKLAKGLKFRSNFSYTKTNSMVKTFTTKVPEIGRISTSNKLEQTTGDKTDILAEQTLSYDHRWNNHHIDAVGGVTYQNTTTTSTYVYGTDFDNEDKEYRYLENAGVIYKPTDVNNKQVLESYLARVNYDYASKYLLSVLGRRDGSSLVSKQNRFENYYSISGGWVLSKEKFLSNVSWIDLLKVRGSYGVLGNLGSLPAYSVSAPLATTTAYFGSSSAQAYGYSANILSNPDLKWAKSKQTDVGIDFNFLRNHFSMSVDYFNKLTSRMIMLQQLPSTSGVTGGQYINAGDARDRGLDFSLNYNSDQHRAFTYSVGMNFTKVSNKLLSLYGDNTSLSTTDINVRGVMMPVAIQVGDPLYAFNLVSTDGIFKSQEEIDNYKNASGGLIQPNAKPGDLKFIDANGDGTINDNDRVIKGSAFPNFSYGFSFNAAYKGFDINLFFQGVHGNKIFNSMKYLGLQAGLGGQHYNLWNKAENAWSESNPNGDVPRLSFADANGNYSVNSDYFLESGSYLRLKNLTIGYTFKNSLMKKLKLSSVRLFATSNNLLTFTKYTGFDPEVGMDNYGIDVARYPQARTILMGLNVNF
ncbi:SusC/RagA family TonB-linked outer membrane protein [Rhizosphaericola mali]|uniref:TonB-dependent receptor n=1 Tax=Rhizosphaericola mali TaxID=2545455 RepID=A0A5P2G3P8_9BACT|nr:TonB-dependent receptor [Rhizosphaericola mali]QES89827.1 TonB-dependent receptor [Rhizosphaericola mali]